MTNAQSAAIARIKERGFSYLKKAALSERLCNRDSAEFWRGCAISCLREAAARKAEIEARQ